MAKRTAANTKEAWRRKKKLRRAIELSTPYVGAKRATPEEQSVECYLETLAFSLKVSRQPHLTPDRKAEAMRLHLALKEARVFHISGDAYVAVHQEVDRHLTTLAGLDYDGFEVTNDTSTKYARFLMKAAKHQAYPEQMPFPVVFLGYGSGVRLPPHVIALKAPSALKDRLVDAVLHGHLMTDTGLAIACFRGYCDDQEGPYFWCDESRTPEYGWTRGLDVEPWTLPHMIRMINDHRTFVVETELSGEIKQTIAKNRTPLGLTDYAHMPKPYYTLRLKSQVIQEKVRRQLKRPRNPATYRTDVRGHERCRIRRGKMPIDSELATTLHERGYKLFTVNTLDEDTYRRLSERGLAYKRTDEWLAIKTTWVADFMSSNDPKLPYIPAVRTLGNVRVRPRQPTGSWVDDPASK